MNRKKAQKNRLCLSFKNWCERRGSNPYAFRAHASETCLSASSNTAAISHASITHHISRSLHHFAMPIRQASWCVCSTKGGLSSSKTRMTCQLLTLTVRNTAAIIKVPNSSHPIISSVPNICLDCLIN